MASKKILILLIAAWLDVYNSPVSAQTLNTQFLGWIGKNQHGYYLDESDWHYCFGGSGGSCGTVALTTGHSSCHTTGFTVGAKWKIPIKIGGMEIDVGINKSWTACNIRSETVTCDPNPGWKGRAVINFSERWGKVHVTGGDDYPSLGSCPAGCRADWQGDMFWLCTYVGGAYDREGYLPEWRGSSCNYQRI
ncbi:hypothetical protein FSB08_37590 [Paraburkholderia sp. JPY432]|uniref:hypothetical protein n=1 Tax=Paraburkholderia youngii TaxID=2782701 RepID=UPI0015958F71|nr:hypothetical protein [Paraburkholderia youngii]NVH78031.1 hypothetical protein [Paraburkholderia youngii]